MTAKRTVRAKPTGKCAAGKHGLDYEGQPCDLCPPQRRQVTISIAAPMAVTITVKRQPGADDWEVEDVVRVDAEISARGVTEHARDEDIETMQRLADAAEDLK